MVLICSMNDIKYGTVVKGNVLMEKGIILGTTILSYYCSMSPLVCSNTKSHWSGNSQTLTQEGYLAITLEGACKHCTIHDSIANTKLAMLTRHTRCSCSSIDKYDAVDDSSL